MRTGYALALWLMVVGVIGVFSWVAYTNSERDMSPRTEFAWGWGSLWAILIGAVVAICTFVFDILAWGWR